jgi:uncharacterized protein YbbC (DUF1343 family)
MACATISCQCAIKKTDAPKPPVSQPTSPIPGAERLAEYLPLLEGKKVGLVVNHTSRVGQVHLLDTLLRLGVRVKAVFAPEHGFRGDAAAGEKIVDSTDPVTGIPVISLYGQKKKPTPDDLRELDWLVFDIQDVGVRFYTYLSTLHYVLEACAEANLPMLVLDRPNPNAHYVDGPVIKPGFESFVGMHRIPVVYGMTLAECARMINEEGWLAGGRKGRLQWVACQNYTHQTPYELPVRPSPNLPNMRAVYLYPSLCFFEGTIVSEGRGTDYPFQVYGHPDLLTGSYLFTPQPRAEAKSPKFAGVQCVGASLVGLSPDEIRSWRRLNLEFLIGVYQVLKLNHPDFFQPKDFFDKLAGSEILRKQIENGTPAEEIRASWTPDLLAFKALRQKYLLYPD